MKFGVYNDRKHPLSILSKERIKSYLKQTEEQNAELFFFEIDNVHFETFEIMGTFFEEKQLVHRLTSFPDLILNESSTSYDKVKDREKELKLKSEIPFISHLIGDKLLIDHILRTSNQFEEYLIPSAPLTSFKDVFEMPHPLVLLKPTNSGKGQGIHILKKVSETRFLHITGDQKKQIPVLQFKKLISELKRQGNYMVQPYITSRTKEGNTFHMRVHLIRNLEAKWVCLIVLADVAEPGRYTSNYKGNTTIRGIDFLVQQYGINGDNVYNRLEKLSLQIADEIDHYYPFTIDELAMDFAITPEKEIKFFEANTGPEIIAFAEERENERAFHRIGYAKTIVKALEKTPLEDRKGKHFKITAKK
ncbi:YheC/YheD family protein [Jeotgalibacillus sp. JSM ZJ347]|uniref:YheC/YheD family protein n=1 Tax=Jeotgalibacillus sp. JSM ZJ347 TaxID=3342117 RepID=UPI0035A880F2